MKTGYTEFSFGYAFTENLIRAALNGPASAPVFPNLIQEAQLGYDVKIKFPGIPLFFQYKLPEVMKRQSAMELSKYNLPGLSLPFFRIHLMRRNISDQHKLLVGLESKFPNRVFYAAPALKNPTEFNRAYRVSAVHKRSVFFSPKEIGFLPDNRDHVISYSSKTPVGWLCSDPKQISASSFAALEQSVISLLHAEPRFDLQSLARGLVREILSVVPANMREIEPAIRERLNIPTEPPIDFPELSPDVRETANEILVARAIARFCLGLELTIAQSRF